MEIILIFFIGILGGYLGIKAKIPAGAILGSLIAVSAYNIIFGTTPLPSPLKYVVQLVTGIFVGIKIKASDVKELRGIIKPAIFIVASMIGFNLIIVFVLHKFAGMDLATALFASSPGGLANMLILAYEFNTDVSIVASLQLVRFVSILIILPNVVKYMGVKKNTEEIAAVENKEIKKKPVEKDRFRRFVTAIVIGSVGGIIGHYSKIPAGILTMSMVFIAAYNVKKEQLYMPNMFVKTVQILAGILIGERITLKDIVRLKDIGASAVILVVGFILLTLIIGTLVRKYTNFNTATSYFASAPGGLTDLTIISAEVGAEAHKVAVIHLLRLICVIGLYPFIITWILS